MRTFAYDLALERYVQAAQNWLNQRQIGLDTSDEVDRLRRAFRRAEKRDRKSAKRARLAA